MGASDYNRSILLTLVSLIVFLGMLSPATAIGNRDLDCNADVVISIDSTGSMGWTDPSGARKVYAKNFVDELSLIPYSESYPQDLAGVVIWDYSLLGGLTFSNDSAQIKSVIDIAGAFGGTNLDVGLGRAMYLFEYASRTSVPHGKLFRAIVFLSDGGDGGGAVYTPSGYIGSQADMARDYGVRIYAINVKGGMSMAAMQAQTNEVSNTNASAKTEALAHTEASITETTNGMVVAAVTEMTPEEQLMDMAQATGGKYYSSMPRMEQLIEDMSTDCNTPVVLIHGIGGSAEGTWQLNNKITESGFVTHRVDLGDTVNRPIEEIARSAQIGISNTKFSYGANQVDIVAYSMGGLVARYYIQSDMYQGDVRKLIMVGTPNHGSVLANFRKIPVLADVISQNMWGADVSNSPSVKEMEPHSDFLEMLNGHDGEDSKDDSFDSKGVQYFVEGGTDIPTFSEGPTMCVPVAALPFIRIKCFHIPRIDDDETGDMIVTERSARLDSVPSTFFGEGDPNGAATHFVLPRHLGVLTQAVYYLYDDPPLPTNDSSNETAPFAQFNQESSVIEPGNSIQYQVFSDDRVTDSYFELVSLANLTITITTPDNQVIDSSTNDPEISYKSGEGFQYFRINKSISGTWTVQISNTGSENASYILTTAGETWLYLLAATNQSSYHVGDNVQVEVLVYNNDPDASGHERKNLGVISATSIGGQLIAPDKSTSPLTFYDDGMHDDGAAADGIFMANVMPSMKGTYRIQVNSTSSIDASNFARSTEIAFTATMINDLAVSNLAFSNENPMQNETIILSADLTNNGEETIKAGVFFMEGAPIDGGKIIAEININSISPGQTLQISTPWQALPGKYTIHAIISPYTPYREVDYSNNAVNRTLWVTALHYIDGCANLTDGHSVYILTQNVVNLENRECMKFVNGSITLDCSGFSITGNRSSYSNYGIRTYSNNNLVIENCVVDSTGDYAYDFGNSKNVIIRNNKALNSYYGFVGNLNNAIVENNYVFNTSYYGFDISATNSIIEGNVALATGSDGFSLGGSNVTVIGNSAYNCYYGFGGSVSNSTIKNNYAINTSYFAFSMGGTTNSLIEGNVVSNTNYGFDLGKNNTIINNSVSGGNYVGFYLDTGCVIKNNRVSGGMWGFYGGSNNFIAENIVSGVSQNAFSPNENNILISNVADHCSYGFNIGNNNTLINNTITNGNQGIYISGHVNNTIKENSIIHNSNGVYFYSAKTNVVEKNKFFNNTNSGMYFYNSNENLIRDNIFNKNKNGLYFYSKSFNNSIYNNIFNNTKNVYGEKGNNTWNITKTSGKNIIGDSYLGGNYWSDYNGSDLDVDGIGDTNLPYNCSNNIIGGDYLPLVSTDMDKDGILNNVDNCWYIPNPVQKDSNGDCPAKPYTTDPKCGDPCEVLEVQINPSIVTAGNNINISISTAPQGIYNVVYIYRYPSFFKDYFIFFNCATGTCNNPINATYNIPTSWPTGQYFFALYDYSETNYSKMFKMFFFNVTGGAPLRNLSARITPSTVVAGSNVSIQIFPGTEGIQRYVYLYSARDGRYRTYFYITTTMCPYYEKLGYCYTPINLSYYIPANSTEWVNAKYYFLIYDLSEPTSWINGMPSWGYSKPKNFTFNLTGGMIPRNMSINVTPKIVQAGNSIYVNLTPSTEGTFKYAYIYKDRYGGIYKNYTYFSCGSNTTTWELCYTPTNFSINIPSWWVSDRYYLFVYDYSVNWNSPDVWKKVYFNVTNGTTLRNLSVIMKTNFVMGENLLVQITPGSEGIYPYIYFYRTTGSYVSYESLYGQCPSYYCYTPVNLSASIYSPGQYKMQVWNLNINNYSSYYFNVSS